MVDDETLAGEFAYLSERQGSIIFEAQTEDEYSRLRVKHASAPVLEPMTILLFGTGLVGLVGFKLRRKK